MTVAVEFALPAESFAFGRATNGDPDVLVEIERLVMAGDNRIPYLWATGEDLNQFEAQLRDSEVVTHVERVSCTGDCTLYSVEWYEDKEAFLNGVIDTGGTIVEGSRNTYWSFTVRFENPSALKQFHQFYSAHDYPVTVDRVYGLNELLEGARSFDLSHRQREALLLALDRGYFGVPRQVKLQEIAEELGISRQATSERIRRGGENVLRRALRGAGPGRGTKGRGRTGRSPSDLRS